MQLRKIIRESIEEISTENMLQQIWFLKGFDCINSSGGVWEYHKKTRSDGYYLHVIIKGGERWTMSLDTHWNKLSDENTSNMGREYKMDFGPYESLGEMIEDVNRRLKNNPIISPDVHEDDQSFEIKKELVDMLERLGEIGMEKLSSSIGRDAGFDDIVEICNLIQGKSRRELAKFVKKEYSGSSDQQKLYSILQKMERMNFHADMGRMMYENISTNYPNKKNIMNFLRQNMVSRVDYPIFHAFIIGSEAKGTANEESDLDIAIVIPKSERITALKRTERYHEKFYSDGQKPKWNGRIVDFQFFYEDDKELEGYPKIKIF